MGAADLLDAFVSQEENACMGKTCAKRVQMAIVEAHSTFVTSKVKTLTKCAILRYSKADVHSVDFDEEHGPDRLLITELSTCGLVERIRNVAFQGLTATDKPILPARSRRRHASDVSGPAMSGAPILRSAGKRRAIVRGQAQAYPQVRIIPGHRAGRVAAGPVQRAVPQLPARTHGSALRNDVFSTKKPGTASNYASARSNQFEYIAHGRESPV